MCVGGCLSLCQDIWFVLCEIHLYPKLSAPVTLKAGKVLVESGWMDGWMETDFEIRSSFGTENRCMVCYLHHFVMEPYLRSAVGCRMSSHEESLNQEVWRNLDAWNGITCLHHICDIQNQSLAIERDLVDFYSVKITMRWTRAGKRNSIAFGNWSYTVIIYHHLRKESFKGK